MEIAKQGFVRSVVLGSAVIGAVALAVPASASSSGSTIDGPEDHVVISYDDASNRFCASMETAASEFLPVIKFLDPEIRVVPEDGVSGPTRIFNINPGETKCVSLEGAVEDSRYYYQVGNRAPIYFYS